MFFHVLLEDGRCKRCHQDQIRPRIVGDSHPEMSEIEADDIITPTPSVTVPTTGAPASEQELVQSVPPDPAPSHVQTSPAS